MVQKLGVQLYSTVTNKQEERPLSIDTDTLKKEQESAYAKGINKVQEFLAAAELYTVRKQYKIAAFMLHQVAEQSLLTLLQVTTGLRASPHNLDRHIRYSSMESFKLPYLLPQNKDSEKRLFKILQQAYSDARYNEDYSIHFKEVKTRTKQMNALKEEVVNLCKRAFTR